MNIEAFQPLAEFNSRMEKFIAELKSVPLADGSDEVSYPGEIEARNDARIARTDGLTLPADTVSDLAKIAGRCGLSFNVDG
jgi:LDH2 family malate/lactate/ureidoglycolate dehydrogenase